MVSPVILWFWPSKLPVNLEADVPTGTKPPAPHRPAYRPESAVKALPKSMSAPSV